MDAYQILDEIQWERVEVVEGGLEEGAIHILIEYAVVSLRSIPIQLDNRLRKTISFLDLLVALFNPFFKFVFVDGE